MSCGSGYYQLVDIGLLTQAGLARRKWSSFTAKAGFINGRPAPGKVLHVANRPELNVPLKILPLSKRSPAYILVPLYIKPSICPLAISSATYLKISILRASLFFPRELLRYIIVVLSSTATNPTQVQCRTHRSKHAFQRHC